MLLLVQHRHESGDIAHPRLFCLIVFCQRPPRLMFSSLALHSWQYSSWPEAFFSASGMLFYMPYNGFEVSEWSAVWVLEVFSLCALIIVARRDDFLWRRPFDSPLPSSTSVLTSRSLFLENISSRGEHLCGTTQSWVTVWVWAIEQYWGKFNFPMQISGVVQLWFIQLKIIMRSVFSQSHISRASHSSTPPGLLLPGQTWGKLLTHSAFLLQSETIKRINWESLHVLFVCFLISRILKTWKSLSPNQWKI